MYFNFDGKAILWANENAPHEDKIFDEEDMMKAFADTLKEMRTTAKLSSAEMAKYLGIAQSTLSTYETNARTPLLPQAIRICAFFGCSIEDFIAHGLDIGAYDIVDKFCERMNFIQFLRDMPKKKLP